MWGTSHTNRQESLKLRRFCLGRQNKSIVAEVLERRTLLSSYAFSTIATVDTSDETASALIADVAGNLYGSAAITPPGGNTSSSVGIIYEISAETHAVTTLVSFENPSGSPSALSIDSAGNLYGTTAPASGKDGTVFEVQVGTHVLTTLATIHDNTEGNFPSTLNGVIPDLSGNLYGIITSNDYPGAFGSIYEVAATSHTVSTLATLDSYSPTGPLIIDGSGNLYGVATSASVNHETLIFELAAGTDVLSTIATFSGTNGLSISPGLTIDSAGNLYGDTAFGGSGYNGNYPSGNGTVFEVSAGTHLMTTLAQFDSVNGAVPVGPLAMDADGNLFGATTFGGNTAGDGTVFEVSAETHDLITLYWFNNPGAQKAGAALTIDGSGNLYGPATTSGASGNTTIYELTPQAIVGNKTVFIEQPSQVLVGATMSAPITVAIEDANGNVDTTATPNVTLDIASGPTGGSLGGTISVTSVNGLATFSDITLDTPGSYTLATSDGTFAPATSATFVVSPDGWVDTADMNEISGWVVDPSNPSASINIEVDISNGPTLTAAANIPRSDLQAFIGSTDHGFELSTPMLSVGTHTAKIYGVESDGSKLLLATKTLVSQNSLFDEHYYLQYNADVAAAVADGQFASGYDHYLEYGQYEGRSPSPYWDESYYLQENPDVAAAVKAGTISSGFMHYYLYGQFENRSGLLYFNTNYYLNNNPDVAAAVAAGSLTSAFEHYVLFGQYEGRSPMLYFSQSVFDADNTQNSPYVVGPDYPTDFELFVLYGQYNNQTASNYYDEQIYLADNPDVAAAVRFGEFRDGFQHWLMYGQYEGRTAI